jgi:hypothetical protein
MSSHYKQIDGKKYSAELLEIADGLVAGQGDGRISAEDAAVLFDKLAKDHKYTDLEKDTIAYIRENYNWTEAGDAALRFAVRVWAAERGANQ